jgi:hypothetical protein
MPANNSKNNRQRKKGSPDKLRKSKELKPLSLAPLSVGEALRAAIATGPITDSDLRAHKKARKL